MEWVKKNLPGILLAVVLALVGNALSGLIPGRVVGGGVFALLLGMAINPLLTARFAVAKAGIGFVSKKVLRAAIVLMGFSLSFAQVVNVGGLSLVVMLFTLTAAFLGGWLVGRLLKLPWRLSSLISVGTGICGGSAIAAVAPVIEAKDSDIAYAMSATFLFDIAMVILFPILGRTLAMSDLGFGLWAGTAINDTSSVVAAGYAFSDAAGHNALVVKLTRTLAIIPTVLAFSAIQAVSLARANRTGTQEKVKISKIFPYFILLFLVAVAIKSTGIVPEAWCEAITGVSKFCMVMALGAIGAKTNFMEMARSGLKPMLHGFIISTVVVVVSYAVQGIIGLL